MAIKVQNVQNRRLTKAIASIVCCLGAYAGAISLSAVDQAANFRAHRGEAPAIAAVFQTESRPATLAQAVPVAVKATLASAR
ncbi:MAG: hypothetical protein ACREJD_14485 [Phycisphaerales bacterium]